MKAHQLLAYPMHTHPTQYGHGHACRAKFKTECAPCLFMSMLFGVHIGHTQAT